jgi:5-methylcytosine-specific restriction endonuclease McrA
MTMRHRVGKSATPDEDLTLYQLHCRYAILYGADMTTAAALWGGMKGRYPTREAHVSALSGRLCTPGDSPEHAEGLPPGSQPPVGEGATLVQASPTTRRWLQVLRDDLPDLEYAEAKYYAAFKTTSPRRTLAYLNPAKLSIRLFLPLKPGDDPRLEPTPSTSSWAARFPSVFPIAGEADLPTATEFLTRSRAAIGPSTQKKATRRPEYLAAEELSTEVEFLEGSARSVLVNAYERNRRAREKCLRHYGRTCAVCGFNFEARYGEAAAGYIQVHHIVPIAKLGQEYRLDPVTDLQPVCPNCHAVIHRREPPFSIDEVREMLAHEGVDGSRDHTAIPTKVRRPNRAMHATANGGQ